MRYDGIHISTPEELVKRADVCLLAITQIEFDTIKGVLLNPEEITISSPDLRRVIVGFRGNTVCVVAQAMAKRAIRAYGSAMAPLTLISGRHQVSQIFRLRRRGDSETDYYNISYYTFRA